MFGFDAGFIPQLLCVGDRSTGGLAAGVCTLVVSGVIGIGLLQAREPRRVSFGRSLCLGAVLGFLLRCAVVVVYRLR